MVLFTGGDTAWAPRTLAVGCAHLTVRTRSNDIAARPVKLDPGSDEVSRNAAEG